MRTTIKDIARETGLSITTVSLVLNGKGQRISEKHRALVAETAKRMNYRPNQLAVGLIKKKTNTIGLIIPDISNIFFSELTKGIEDAGRKAGYNLILCDSNDKHALELEYMNTLAARGVDGIIVAMSAQSYDGKEDETFSILKKYDLPAIVVDCFNGTKDFSTVAIDNFLGSKLAVDHLVRLGHRRIACVTGPLGPRTNDERFEGYAHAIGETAAEWDERLIYEGDFRYQSGYEGAMRILPHRPTAILCLNDMMAYGAVKALREKGVEIPGDMSVMGFDDIFFSEIMDTPLSTVKQPVYQMGAEAAAILADEIADRGKPRRHARFKPELKIRKSTCPPRREALR